jgi:hypothetical protein
MPYSMYLLVTLATLAQVKTDKKGRQDNSEESDWREVIAPELERMQQLVQEFLGQSVSPMQAHHFEQQMQQELRELGRNVVQWTYNRLESDVDALAKHVWFEASEYTRLNAKTAQSAWTLFGQIRLWRIGYRPTSKSGDATLFPLALSLGLVHGATPALAERAARLLSSAGMSQGQTLKCLCEDHGIGWGVKKLRQVTGAISHAMAEQRHEAQVQKLLELLAKAWASTGKNKPVLSVGRDGITLGTRCRAGSVFEVATTGTVTVLDRRGRRLGTVYLAYIPEFGQKTMSTALTRLLRDVLGRWQGSLPRLSYVTDAGDNETTYYERVLARMKHPRTGQRLEWIRVVDYYHASERVWKLAELLFGKGQQATGWARKMQKWLLKPGGVNRVLHSAAAFREQYGLWSLCGKKQQEFEKAYCYLRDRMKYMRYATYRALRVPLGSGVTEAACKRVYTQRLKLSGMRWRRSGAQTILNLRVLQLSDVWDMAYKRVLEGFDEPQVRGQTRFQAGTLKKPA